MGKSPGVVPFDDYFQGQTTDEKIGNLNKWAEGHGGKPTATVEFDAAAYSHSVPIWLWSGLRMRSGGGTPASEYGRSTILRYGGAAGTSQFKITGSQTNQGYPSDGSPRDVQICGIEFRGGPSVDCIESVQPGTPYAGKVLWMTDFHNCAWNGFRRVWWGYGDGATITGISHFQAYSQTPLWVAGSECSLFGRDGFSFMDSSVPAFVQAGLPAIRTSLSKSSIGEVMVTTRKAMLALHVDGGTGLAVHGLAADSQDSDPAYGANIRVTGSTQNLELSSLSLKGFMANPTAGVGGAAQNRGAIHIDGPVDDVMIDLAKFRRQGSSAPPIDTPLVFVGPSVPANGVKIGLLGTAGWAGVVQQVKAGQLVVIDPTLLIRTVP